MQVGGCAHLADFSPAEKPAQRHIAQFVDKEIGIVVGLAKEALAAAGTGEEQGASRVGLAAGGLVLPEHQIQVISLFQTNADSQTMEQRLGQELIQEIRGQWRRHT